MKPTYDIYPKFEKCIQKLVWKYVKNSRFGFDELLSEAGLAFMKAVDTYDSNKASFHTHLYWTVNGRLRNYCNGTNQIEDKMTLSYDARCNEGIKNSDFNAITKSTWDNNDPEQAYTFKNLVENLSKEAREVVNTLLNTPAEMIELVKEMSASRQGHMHVYKSNVTRYFKNQGWKRKNILKAYSEIRQTFNMG
jgi:DNA-directed RNA polymerase specialized sigma subunit